MSPSAKTSHRMLQLLLARRRKTSLRTGPPLSLCLRRGRT